MTTFTYRYDLDGLRSVTIEPSPETSVHKFPHPVPAGTPISMVTPAGGATITPGIEVTEFHSEIERPPFRSAFFCWPNSEKWSEGEIDLDDDDDEDDDERPDLVNEAVKTIAHWIPTSEHVALDAADARRIRDQITNNNISKPGGTSTMKKDQLKSTIERAKSELARLETLPEDDFLDGAILKIERRFSSYEGAKVYAYAATKADGLWYLTGGSAPQGLTWDDLLDWLSPFDGHLISIEHATQVETIVAEGEFSGEEDLPF